MNLELEKNEIITIKADRKTVNKMSIVCENGMLYITQENDSKDYIIRENDDFLISKKGKVIIQAMTDATMMITHGFEKNIATDITVPLRKNKNSLSINEPVFNN